ncbi:MAG: hypothetical protein IPL75_13765 [Acidobacteria bacterium]|nr:hypothetical protein [Acidobacteriota bacterium]
MTRRVLVVSELALGVLILVGALLMIRTFVTLRPSAPGFDPSHKEVALVRLPPATPEDERLRFFETVREELASQPGIREVAGTTHLPMYGSIAVLDLAIGNTKGEVFTGTASTNYFDLMKIPVVRGRGFRDQDQQGAAPIAVVTRPSCADGCLTASPRRNADAERRRPHWLARDHCGRDRRHAVHGGATPAHVLKSTCRLRKR